MQLQWVMQDSTASLSRASSASDGQTALIASERNPRGLGPLNTCPLGGMITPAADEAVIISFTSQGPELGP